MTETDPMMEALFALHEGLPRQGPGLDSATHAALDRVARALPPRPRVLDLGCGSGAATLVLAEALPERWQALARDLRAFNDPQGIYARLPVHFLGW